MPVDSEVAAWLSGLPSDKRAVAERAMARQHAATPELRVRVEGRVYVIGVGLHAYIRAQRDHAAGFQRGGNAPGHVRVLSRLRSHVAERLGVDRRTAYWVLREIRHR